MNLKLTPFLLAAIFANQPAHAQQSAPSAMVVAQAADRCMTTYAVRLTKTSSTDDEIYKQASEGCASINQRVRQVFTEQFPAAQAAQALRQMDAQARPNFFSMLTRIRSDRARRAGEMPASPTP